MNLRCLNPFLRVEKFKMETLVSILKELRQKRLDESSCSNPCISSEVPAVHVEGLTGSPAHLSVEDFAIWLGHGTQALRDHGYVPIHRRYFSCARFSRGSGEDQRRQCLASSLTGIYYQPSQILLGSFSGHDSPWSPHRHSDG